MAPAQDQPDITLALALEDIPIKLRCASCNKLVKDAYRLPCCDQNVCDVCQTSLPEACPVCMHSPLSAADCKPNKALRLTVKAFLKSEEKKRGKERERFEAEAAAIAVPNLAPTCKSEPQTTPSERGGLSHIQKMDDQRVKDLRHESEIVEAKGLLEDDSSMPSSPDSSVEITLAAPTDVPERGFGRRPVNNADHATEPSTRPAGADASQDSWREGLDNVEAPNGAEDPDQKSTTQHRISSPLTQGAANQAHWLNWSNNAGLNPTLGINAGINPAMWGNFQQMMGMSGMMVGMPMDPVMMQGMFGGFGGQGMDAHGMNMAMGFDGGYTGWNMGMGGDFGANAGYYPTSGYNQQSHQGHFQQMQNAHFPNDHLNQNRLRGQAYRRGNNRDLRYSSGRSLSSQNAQTHAEPSFERNLHQQNSLGTVSEKHDTGLAIGSQDPPKRQTVYESKGDEHPGGGGDRSHDDPLLLAEVVELTSKQEHVSPASVSPAPATEENDQPISRTSEENHTPQAIVTVQSHRIPSVPILADSSPYNGLGHNAATKDLLRDPPAHLGQITHVSGATASDSIEGQKSSYAHVPGGHESRVGFRGRRQLSCANEADQNKDQVGNSLEAATAELAGQGVSGAPTGPKAMREGMHTAGFRGRGGFQIVGRGFQKTASTSGVRATVVIPDASNDAPARPKRSNRSISPSDQDHRGYEQRSRSASIDGGDRKRERRMDRKQRHSRRRSREVSLESASISALRSSREHGQYRSSRHERERSRDRRKKRHRSRSPVRDETEDKVEYPRSSSKHEAAVHDVELGLVAKRRRSGHERPLHGTGEKSEGRLDGSTKIVKRRDHKDVVLTAPKEFKIKNRSKRTELEIQKELVMQEHPSIDPHSLEREARNRERLLKEEQRRESLTAGGEKKRSRATANGAANPAFGNGEDDYNKSRKKLKHEDGSGQRHRKISYKYEDDENEEVRRRREVEREAARWR